MVDPIQLYLNRILDVEYPASTVVAMNYIDYFGERYIQIEREDGHRDATIPIFDFDTFDDIRIRILSHPAYY